MVWYIVILIVAVIVTAIVVRAKYRVQPLPLPDDSTRIFFRVTDRATGFSIEGENLQMNLKNTEEVDLEVKPRNRKGGPATGVSGTYSAITPTGAFTVEVDAANPLKALAKGNPQATGDENDVGIARFEGTRTASDGTTVPVSSEIAINILPADSVTEEMTAGTPREQA